MKSLTKVLSFLAAIVLLPVLAPTADAIPHRYFVPNYGHSSGKKATKRVAAKPTRRAVIKNYVAYSASSRSHGKKHASYQRRVPSISHFGGGSLGDYLSQVGGNSRWPSGKTIHVYVAPGRPSYRNIVANAMNQWSRASGGQLNWTLTGNPGSADYTIGWTSTQREVSSGTEAGLTTTDTMVDPGSGSETIDHAQTRILTRYNGRSLSDSQIAETTLHEIGHALGLEGHSSNPHDIMYYAAVKGQGGLTARDMNTISRLYSQ